MKEYTFWGFRVNVDESATREWYAGAETWGCECGHCRHFVELARKRALPAPVLKALDELGIPAEKATYVCEIVPEGAGHLYQFSYRLAGTILQEGAAGTESWGEGRCCHEPYPYGAPGFPEPHFDLEFWVVLPGEPEEL